MIKYKLTQRVAVWQDRIYYVSVGPDDEDVDWSDTDDPWDAVTNGMVSGDIETLDDVEMIISEYRTEVEDSS